MFSGVYTWMHNIIPFGISSISRFDMTVSEPSCWEFFCLWQKLWWSFDVNIWWHLERRIWIGFPYFDRSYNKIVFLRTTKSIYKSRSLCWLERTENYFHGQIFFSNLTIGTQWSSKIKRNRARWFILIVCYPKVY
jgi:hypothetical protein